MNTTPPQLSIQVQPLSSRWESQAWDLLLSDLPVEERPAQIAAIQAFAKGRALDPENLWIAIQDDSLCGVLLQIPQPGRVAFVWPPVIATSQTEESAANIADALVQRANGHADASGIQFSQVLLAEGDSVPPPSLCRNGYNLKATLLVQERALGAGALIPIHVTLQEEPYQECHAKRLARLVESTFEGTQDCPAVARWRTGLDALERHRAAAPERLRHWSFLKSEGRDVAVLLLVENEADSVVEIDYFGVIPEARGRGYGRQTIHYGMNFARERGAGSLRAFVDSNNHYACKVYAECGFAVTSDRTVLVRMHPRFAASSLDTFSPPERKSESRSEN